MSHIDNQIRPRKKMLVSYGSELISVIAAASFACILTLIALQRTDWSGTSAMTAFCMVLPIAVAHRVVTADPVRQYRVSFLHKLLTPLALFAFVIGLTILIDTVSRLAAVIFPLLSGAMVLIVDKAEQRAKRL